MSDELQHQQHDHEEEKEVMVEETESNSEELGEVLKYQGNLWNKYDKIHSRIYHGKHAVKELHVLLEKNKKGMESYCKVLKKQKLTTGDNLWGLKVSLVGLSNYYNITNKFMHDAAEKEHVLHKELKDYKNELKHANAAHEKTLNRLKKELDGFIAEANSKAKGDKAAAEALKKAVLNLEKAREEKNPDKQKKAVEKGESLLEQAKTKAVNAREDYAKSIKKLRIKDAHFYKGLDDLLNEIEQFDRERLNKTKTYLKRIATLQINMTQEMLKTAQELHDRAEAIDVDKDIHSFIEQTRDDETPPPPLDFVPYFASKDGINDPVNTAPNDLPLDPDAPLADTNAGARPQESSSVAATKGTPPPPPAPSSTTNNLSATKGTPPPPPSSSQQHPPPPPPTSSTQKKDEVLEVVTAAFEYADDEDPEALCFKPGDKIEVLSKDEGDWWRGRLNGREGLFPYNYMVGYEDQEVEEEVIEEVIVDYDYESQADEELELQKDDVISVLHKHDDGWHEGINKRTGDRGLFPANYAHAS